MIHARHSRQTSVRKSTSELFNISSVLRYSVGVKLSAARHDASVDVEKPILIFRKFLTRPNSGWIYAVIRCAVSLMTHYCEKRQMRSRVFDCHRIVRIDERCRLGSLITER
jgi:hypothetical protein